ncbi:MAG: MFS transporter [Verrucomicrobia bacterium]|jgi:maltose/moltooligosaccharide transporter|nr:MFS transporter [Verrucomicrobiota bacterium]
MQHRPELSFWQVWNMSFGFFGIQFGWGLQMANMSAIYSYLGAHAEQIPLLWLAAPLTGLLVQPIVGYYSDRTWTRLGRRRPYFLVGAIFASLALVAMPNSSTLWMAAGLLWILDASVNVSMEPFRAFVGDLLPPQQRKFGFAMQSLLIGLGAVLSSAMPWLLTNVLGVSNEPTGDSAIPLTVHISFYTGALLFFAAVLYTVVRTKEYPPEDMAAFEKERAERGGPLKVFMEIIRGITSMPRVMAQLAIPQFFTWFALFCLWINFAPAVATNLYDPDTTSAAYRAGAEWAGVCFSIYNAVAFFFSFFLLYLVRKFSAKAIHTLCLAIGGVGMLSVGFVTDPLWLIASMIGIGIAWASILAMPYAMLSNGIPQEKMGFYMGVFNFFLVLPQIFASVALGPIMRAFLGGEPMNVILVGGASLLVAMGTLRFVDEERSEGLVSPPAAD